MFPLFHNFLRSHGSFLKVLENVRNDSNTLYLSSYLKICFPEKCKFQHSDSLCACILLIFPLIVAAIILDEKCAIS